MPARFVNLQCQLRRVEDECSNSAGALRCGQQCNRFRGDARRVFDQLHRFDELVALCGLLPSDGIGVRPRLYFVLAHRGDLDAAATLDDFLLDETPLRAGEGLALANELQTRFRDANLLFSAYLRVRR